MPPARLPSQLRSSALPPASLIPAITAHTLPVHHHAQARHASSRSSSSSQWLARQSRDPFVKSRQSTSTDPHSASPSYVARSAFKLLELHHKTRLLRPGITLVDLGAAPGGWVQAAHPLVFPAKGKDRAGRKGSIIALDLLPLHKSLDTLEGVHFLQGDFLDPITQARLLDSLGGKAGGGVDLVVSDMLANLSGNTFRDAQLSLDLCQAALQFALLHLAPTAEKSAGGEAAGAEAGEKARGGKDSQSPVRLVLKHLRSELSPEFEQELKKHFGSVRWEKPASSRAESREGFWLCRQLKPLSQRGRG